MPQPNLAGEFLVDSVSLANEVHKILDGRDIRHTVIQTGDGSC